MCKIDWDEHDEYTATDETWDEVLPDKIVTWRIWRCECSARKSDRFESSRPR
ncbi:hypothetical protein [Amycolatopsis sp. cmx-4-68]|uniref:hypothetical protein n=1 Tax=Amycolatopsis sp. cmx-4-68 TaxID=2790938 RepID=UPI003979AE11